MSSFTNLLGSGLGSTRSSARSVVSTPFWNVSLLVGGLIGSGCGFVLMAIAALFWGKSEAFASVALTTALVLGYFVLGSVFDALGVRFADLRGLALVLGSYGLRIAIFGFLLYRFLIGPSKLLWVDHSWLFFTTVVVVVGWVTGLVKTYSKQRILIYDEPSSVEDGER